MRIRDRLAALLGRAEGLVGRVIVLSVLGLAVLTPTAVLTIEQTSQPEFCNSCHIMEPYYESWLNSSHADISCIECHYEPGAVETFAGKVKALNQVTKYVTRSEGTKPWAEVSDQSCMREGCHSVRLLEGELEFGRIKFDHRHHLLESRRGRRLRCTSCHSQIVQGDHLNVTESVCFMCHFMPGMEPQALERTSDCLTCHGPPDKVVDVDGQPFDHEEYLARGVDCRECHDPVIEGEGTVRRERCHSCHGDVGHIERFGETEFLHEQHVTEKKVECFECHDEILHGLLPQKVPEPSKGEGCGSCHVDSHDASRMVYAGTGAIGVEDRPSRMYETRVVCDACHTGRSGRVSRSDDVAVTSAHAGMSVGHASFGSSVAKAGSVDCIHCHGTGYDGMLEDWQGAVTEQLERLDPILEQLEARAVESPNEAAAELLAEARHNVRLVKLDGSRGVHNVLYALNALRAGAERLDEARTLVAPDLEVDATEGMPFVSSHGCSECHLGIEQRKVFAADARPFSHGKHLTGQMDCQSCHSITDHGQPAVDRADCSSCHHQESEGFDVYECATCHKTQNGFLTGVMQGFETKPSVMADMECTECHGDPPDLVLPKPAMCVLCHEEGYDEMMGQWQGAVDALLSELLPLRDELSAAAGEADRGPRKTFEQAERELETVLVDGSRGVHNVHLTLDVLRAAAEKLTRVSQATGVAADLPDVDFTVDTEEGCSTCHIGFEQEDVTTADGLAFPHRRHLQDAKLECATCHSLEEHGQPAPSRNCGSCHHQESEGFGIQECGSCHQAQTDFLTGEPGGFAPLEGPKGHLECTVCHGEHAENPRPSGSLCRVCHGRGVDDEVAAWEESFAALRDRLVRAIEGAGDEDSEAVRKARAALATVDRDRSNGIHNSLLARRLIEDALRSLE